MLGAQAYRLVVMTGGLITFVVAHVQLARATTVNMLGKNEKVFYHIGCSRTHWCMLLHSTPSNFMGDSKLRGFHTSDVNDRLHASISEISVFNQPPK